MMGSKPPKHSPIGGDVDRMLCAEVAGTSLTVACPSRVWKHSSHLHQSKLEQTVCSYSWFLFVFYREIWEFYVVIMFLCFYNKFFWSTCTWDLKPVAVSLTKKKLVTTQFCINTFVKSWINLMPLKDDTLYVYKLSSNWFQKKKLVFIKFSSF